MRTTLAGLTLAILLATAAPAEAQTCWIFVHGRQGDAATRDSYTAARDYWRLDQIWPLSDYDGVNTIRNGSERFYVVGYNGSDSYHQAAWTSAGMGEVTRELLNATSGVADAGGNSCAGATTYNVVAHSMGNAVMDFILGNYRTTDAYYRGEYATIRSRVARVVSLAGAHRGSQLADAACWTSGGACDIGGVFAACNGAEYWLQTGSSTEVRSFANSPGRSFYLFGGWEADAAQPCLNGEDDGVLSYPSIFACSNVSSTASLSTSGVCGNSTHIEGADPTYGTMFRNGDQSHEDHSNIADGSDTDDRRSIPDGIWTCGGVPCANNTLVTDNNTPALVRDLW